MFSLGFHIIFLINTFHVIPKVFPLDVLKAEGKEVELYLYFLRKHISFHILTMQ